MASSLLSFSLLFLPFVLALSMETQIEKLRASNLRISDVIYVQRSPCQQNPG